MPLTDLTCNFGDDFVDTGALRLFALPNLFEFIVGPDLLGCALGAGGVAAEGLAGVFSEVQALGLEPQSAYDNDDFIRIWFRH